MRSASIRGSRKASGYLVPSSITVKIYLFLFLVLHMKRIGMKCCHMHFLLIERRHMRRQDFLRLNCYMGPSSITVKIYLFPFLVRLNGPTISIAILLNGSLMIGVFTIGTLTLAHDRPMSGHLGPGKCKQSVFQSFYWPGVFADVTRHCRSCDICQRTSKRDNVKVPMVKTRHTYSAK
jgi:hypothetical protein